MLKASEARNIAIINNKEELNQCLKFLEGQIVYNSEKGLRELVIPNWLRFNGNSCSEESLVNCIAVLRELGYEVLIDPGSSFSINSKIYIRW